MVRISAVFIAVCMVLIAVSLGIVVYLRFGLSGTESALVALGALTALAVYHAVSARMRDRAEASAQISGFLFAPPRPVRAEALQATNGEAPKEHAKQHGKSAAAPVAASSRGTLAQLIRAGAGRG